VNDTGPIYGRDAIEKHYADVFKQVHFSNHIIKGQDWGPKEFKGNWVEIYRREGDDWRIRLDIWNLTPAPAPATTPSPTSSKQ
jgi:hypothetical protein